MIHRFASKGVPALTRQQAREIDRRAVEEYGLPSIVLMENAGRGVCDWLVNAEVAEPIVVCCGPGNNGGDGFVVARHLDLRRKRVAVRVFAEPARFQGDAAVNLAVLQKSGVPIEFVPGDADEAREAATLADAGCLVDALLGTGFHGDVRPPLDRAIDRLNASGRPIIAVDVPSGLDCDTGRPATHTIRACRTLTFVDRKIGFDAPEAQPYLGDVQVLDIGAPRKLVEEVLRETKN